MGIENRSVPLALTNHMWFVAHEHSGLQRHDPPTNVDLPADLAALVVDQRRDDRL